MTLQDTSARPDAIADWVGLSPLELYTAPEGDVAALQLAAARAAFEKLAPRLPILARLAREQGVEAIDSFDSLALLLFRHNLYKSYPLSVLEKEDFGRLTRWLSGLTSVDLSGIDASGCTSIDEWIDLLDRETDIRVIHSSGTTGKLSFLPRTSSEFGTWDLPAWRHFFRDFDDEGDAAEGIEDLPIVNPGYASGALVGPRRMTQMVHHWHRGRDIPVVSLRPERLSADAQSLAGRIRAAEQRGELGTLALSPRLMARKDELLRSAAPSPQRMDDFMAALAAMRGQRVQIFGTLSIYYDMALAAEARGLTGMFAPDSMIAMGGGNKGRDLPAGWEQTLFAFLGRTVRNSYGMSELSGGAVRACSQGHYHLPPWVVPFILDPATGAVAPRHGLRRGRFGFFDTLAQTYWGGFLSGDEVTLQWPDAGACPCGRNGPFLHAAIRRLSEQEGGDDKVTCAGAPEAQDRALDFLKDIAG